MTQQWEALIVGIDFYRTVFTDYHELQNLTVACKDAKDIAQQLQQYGYESFRIQSLPQQPYQKGEEPNLSALGVKSDQLKDKIKNLFNPPSLQETPDLALFYFSGHGWRKIVDEKEDTFLATSDVFPNAGNYGISLRWLGEQIQKSPVKKIIIWLDCCFSGELINYLPQNKDYCLITATRSFETGLEISYEQGLFTRTLLKGLNPENYADGIVDSHKLKEFVEKQMLQTSQRPLIKNSLGSILLTTRDTLADFKGKCPYRSLSYFAENRKDAEVFYGRSKITNHLINRLQKDRLICVLGASGSGKSSLLRAGLLYQLKLGQVITGSNLWTYLTPFSPTENPLQQLKDVWNDPPLTPPSQGGELAKIGPSSQEEELEKIAPLNKGGWRDQNPIIMIIDQFEECFTMCDQSTNETFFQQLIKLLNDYPNLHTIIGMRSDYRGRLREHKILVDALNKPYINIEHLNREEIEEVIMKPAEKSGVLIESSLKQQLINDVEDYPGSLPLLQYTLTRLWEETRNQGERFLTLKTYQDLGGIEGTLEKRANEVYNSLDKKEKEIAQRIFLELTQVGDTFDTRRRVYLHDLVNSYHSFQQLDDVSQKLANEENRLVTRTEVDKGKWGDKEIVVNKLWLLIMSRVSVSVLAAKILTPNPEPRTPNSDSILIDVVHEALIRNWGMLRKWQEEYKEGMVIERKIEASTKDWQEKGQKTSDLLQGSKLGEAEGYLQDFSQLGMLDGIAEEYVKKSQRHQRNLRRNWLIGGIVGGTILSVLTISATISSLQSQQLALNAELQAEATNIKYGLSVQPTVEELIQAIATTAKSQEEQKFLQPKVINEVNSSLLAALDRVRERNLLRHRGYVNAIAFSPDGQQILSGSDDGTVRLWDRESGQLLHTFEGHRGPVNAIAFSPDGRQILSGSDDDTLRLWDRESGQLIHTFEGHQGPIWEIAFSPDGQQILSGSHDETVRLWDAKSGRLLHTFESHRDPVYVIAFSPDGQQILSGSYDNTVRLWDTDSGQLLHTFEGHIDRVWAIAFSPDGQQILSGSYDNTVRLWDTDSGQLIYTLTSHTDAVTEIAFSPDGQQILSGSHDKTVRLWDTDSGQLLHTLEGHTGYVNAIAFSPDGQQILSGSRDNTVRLWDRESGQLIHTFEGHTSFVNTIAFSPDGQKILSGGNDETVRLWNRESGKPVHTLAGHTDAVYAIAFSPDGRQILSGSGDNTVRLWNRESGQLIHTFEGHTNAVTEIAFSADGQQILSGNTDNTVRLWDAKSGQLLHTLEGHTEPVSAIALSPDGQQILSGSYDETVRLWDRESGKPVHTLTGHISFITAIAFSPDGQQILSSGQDKIVRLWDRESGKPVHTLTGHTHGVYAIAFSPDGQQILSSSHDKTVRLWDRKSGKPVHTLTGHTDYVNAIAFSFDGQQILSSSHDKTVRLWDRESGQLLHTFEGHTSSISAIAFSPDGQQILSGSGDKTVRLWDAKSGQLLHTLEGQTDAVTAIAFSPDGKQILSGSHDNTVRLWRNYSWQEALTEGCNRLYFHTALVAPKNELAGKACLKYASWEDKAKAAFLVRQGRSALQNEQNLKDAVRKFKEAQNLQPEIDLNPDTQEIDKNPKIVARKIVAPFKVEEGEKLAIEGKVKEAITAYKEAQKLAPKLKTKAESWNTLCWLGSVNKQAKDVLFACENAVNNAKNDYDKASYIDSRGLARALTGDFDSAIKDFQVFIDNSDASDYSINKRKQWIESLKKGENPFTDEVLEELKNE